jgi:hypothetical protein
VTDLCSGLLDFLLCLSPLSTEPPNITTTHTHTHTHTLPSHSIITTSPLPHRGTQSCPMILDLDRNERQLELPEPKSRSPGESWWDRFHVLILYQSNTNEALLPGCLHSFLWMSRHSESRTPHWNVILPFSLVHFLSFVVDQGCQIQFAPGVAFGLQRGPEDSTRNVLYFFAFFFYLSIYRFLAFLMLPDCLAFI